MNSDFRRYSASRLLAILLISALLYGCDSNDSGLDADDPDSLIGSYRLVSLTDMSGEITTVDGATLEAGVPRTFTTTQDGQTVDFSITVDGNLTLSATTYSVSITIEIASGNFSDTSTDSETGTWSLSNGTLTFRSDDSDHGDGDTFELTASDNRITIADSKVSAVFEKV